MSGVIEISSPNEFDTLLRTRILVTDFYAEWCRPCKMIAPFYEELSKHLSIPDQVTFVKVNIEKHQTIASRYNIASVPTFIVFKNLQQLERIEGGDFEKVQSVVQKLIAESHGTTEISGSGGPSSSVSNWRLAELPKGYSDVTDQADLKGLDLLNADNEFGRVQVLFDDRRPSALQEKASTITTKDWVESDTDEQLMLYIPFRSTLKVHSLQITSIPSSTPSDQGKVPIRPKTVHIYSNRANILGFEEAEETSATQTVTLKESDWDATGTATIALRFVKFQNVSSLVLFIVDGLGEGSCTRLDRIRIIGECGEKRDLGKLEKVED